MRNWTARSVACLMLAGCGPLADDQTAGATLAKLHGTLSLGEGVKPPKGEMRVAVIWQDPDSFDAEASGLCENAQLTGWRHETRLLQQRAELTTDFPSGFSVNLTEPPPPAAIFDNLHGQGVPGAFGDLVVYADRNGNGRLDLRRFDGTSPDLVLGWSRGATPVSVTSKQYSITYLSRDPEQAPDGQQPSGGRAGYWLEMSEISLFGTPNYQVQRLSEATIDLTLDPNAYVQQAACALRCNVPPDTLDCPDDPSTLISSELGDQLSEDFGVGTSAWLRQDGDETVFSMATCSRPVAGPGQGNGNYYTFDFGLAKTQGCTTTGFSCTYARAALSAESANLPCTQYREVSSGPDEPDEPPQH